MIKQKLIQDSYESDIKNQSLSNSQKENFKTTLSKSRLSRLSYNNVELSPKTDVEIKSEIDRLSKLSLSNSKSSPLRKDLNLNPLSNKFLNGSIETNSFILDKENEKEIDELIESAKSPVKPKSPSSYYLNNIPSLSLSPDEKLYIENQDKNRMRKYQEVTKAVAKSIAQKPSEFSDALKSLKDQQKILKEQNLNLSHHEKKNKDVVDAVVAKPSAKIEQISPARSQNEKEIDTKEIQQIEQRLGSLVDSLKMMRQKCESSEFKELFDSSFHENLRNSIDDIEIVKTNGQNGSGKLNILSHYSKIAQELNQKVNTEIDSKLKAKNEQLEREKEILRQKRLELENNYRNNLKKFHAKFEDVKNLNQKQLDNLLSKTTIIKDLVNEPLLNQSNQLLSSIKIINSEIDNLIKTCQSNVVQGLVESQMNDILLKLNENVSKYSKISDDVQAKIKLIETESQNLIQELLKAKNDKEVAERQKLKESQDLEEKRAREEALRLKLERDAALKRSEQAKQTQMAKVQSVDDNNKRGINNSTLLAYEQTRDSFNKFRKESEDALNTRDFKMYKFELQKAINFPLNTLLEDKTSEENRRNFNEKIKTLVRLLSGQTCTITSTLTVNPTKHPQAIDFCLVYLARKLVEKGEETVASRPETAFQYCQVINEVLKNAKNFEIILMGQLQEKCPYVVPFYKPRLNGQSDEQYFESLGYKIIDGKIEDDVHFYKRMSGVLHLFFTLLITTSNQNSSHGYFSLRKAWQWLTDVLNMTPRANLTAEMLAIFFKCCGYQLKQVYGRQFLKLVDLCMQEYVKMIESIPGDKQSGASVGRLLTVLDYFKKNKQFQEWKKTI